MRNFVLLVVLLANTHPFGVYNTQPFSERQARVLMFTASWCGPCNLAKTEFKRLTSNGWKVNETDSAHIQLVDGDANPTLVAKYGVEMYPTFIAIKGEQVVKTQVGYKGNSLVERTDKIVTLYNDLYK